MNILGRYTGHMCVLYTTYKIENTRDTHETNSASILGREAYRDEMKRDKRAKGPGVYMSDRRTNDTKFFFVTK